MGEKNKNAIDYIKESTLYTEARYQWLKPLIDGVLTDSGENKEIKRVINEKCAIEESEGVENETKTTETVEVKMISHEKEHYGLSQISSIENVSNIGLLEVTEPIPLNNGLNIFYGKNAGGKSSIFSALCKVLGIEKKVYSNINSEDTNCVCTIKILDNEGNENSITWVTDEVKSRKSVKVFDSGISNYLVENDLVNHFEIARLKSEYFSFLHAMFDEVGVELERRHITVQTKMAHFRIKIEAVLPKFFEVAKEITKEDFSNLPLSQGEKQGINEINSELKILTQTNTNAIIKNMEGALELINKISELFGSEKEIESEIGDGKETKKEWKLRYTKKVLERINNRIGTYKDAIQAFNQSKTKLTELVPKGWINKELWDKFIESGIVFIQALEGIEKEKYLNDNCAFCQQPLETPQAKELIKTYQEIQSEYQVKLKEAERKFVQNSSVVEKTIVGIKNIPKWNKQIEAEFTGIGKEGEIYVDLKVLNNIFEKVKSGLDKREIFDVTIEQISTIKEVWENYNLLRNKFRKTIASLTEALMNKEKKIEKLTKEVEPLLHRRALLKVKDEILMYFKTKKLLAKIITCQDDITALKQNASRLETNFAKEEPLKLFEKHLINEYENFHFTTPSIWKISSSTRGGENKRIYSLGDKRLSDVFSDGERKMHALADFFAEAEMNNYKGVYIFDDPVTSLDEERIEYVGERILKLTEDGNQVIVFTHNLVFLNFLVDTEKEPINRVSRLTSQILVEPNLKMDKQLKERHDEIKKRIDELNGIDETKIGEYQLRNIYDLISGYLETYVEVKVFKNVISRYRPNIRMHSLDKLKDFDKSTINDIIKLYKQTSRKGSRHSPPLGTSAPSFPEVKKHFEELITNYKYN